MKIAYFPRPLVTFCARDLLLLERMDVRSTDAVLEIGTGSGSSLFRLARRVAVLHGVDVCEAPLNRLRRVLAGSPEPSLQRVELFQLDFCSEGAFARLPRRYDVVYACDTLEHVACPRSFLQNVYRALSPGGKLFLTFPNESPGNMHGVTAFRTRGELVRLLAACGFPADGLSIDRVDLSPRAAWVVAAGWLTPRRLAKRALRWLRGGGRPLPQTFEQTDYFAAADRLDRLAPLINAYCWLLMRLTGAHRPVYCLDTTPDEVWDMNLLIRAHRP